MKSEGLIIIGIGLVMFIFTTFNLITKEKVIEIGDVEITKDKNNRFSWEPLYGLGLILVGGIVFYLG